MKFRLLLATAVAVAIGIAAPAIAESPRAKPAPTPHAAKIYANSLMKSYGWNQREFGCLKTLWTNESNWRAKAQNKTAVKIISNGKVLKVYAGGIPQILGMNPNMPMETQITKGLTYIKTRYKSPCRALAFWQKGRYWY